MEIIDTLIDKNFVLHNTTRTWQFKSDYLFTPSSLRGVRHCVLRAEQDGKRIRATGSQHSYSKICGDEGIYIISLSAAHPYHENSEFDVNFHNHTVDKIDQSPINLLKDETELPVKPEYYINVPAGLKIHMLNTILCPDKPHQKARFGRKRLFNMGGGDVQSVAGALATGTHGSGGKISSYHDAVRSILIVASGGRIIRVEPTNGITDPEKHKAHFENAGADEKEELIQNDKYFYSCLINLGCFGIVFSVIMEVTDMSNLHEDVYYRQHAWGTQSLRDSIIAKAEQMATGDEELYYYVYLNPHSTDGVNAVSCNEKIVVKTDKPISGKAKFRKRWPSFLAMLDPAAEITQNLVNNNAQPCADLIEKALVMINDNVDTAFGGYTDIAYKVWNTGAGELKTMGTGIEFAFPYSIETIDTVMGHVLNIMKAFAQRSTPYYLNSPIAVRFAKSSEAYMATNYKYYKGKEYNLWCYFELTCIHNNTTEGQLKEAELYNFLQDYLHTEDDATGKLAGRPHWGLNFNFKFNKNMVKALYPEFDTWLEAFKFFNQSQVFDCSFTDSLELRSAVVEDLIA